MSIKVGTAYGALGSLSSVETGSDTDALRGIDPVSRMVIVASVKRLKPKHREKYSSSSKEISEILAGAGSSSLSSGDDSHSCEKDVRVECRASSASNVRITFGVATKAMP